VGIEYQITVSHPDARRLDEDLRAHPHFREFDTTYQLYQFSLEAGGTGMSCPDASVAIGSNGLYFCDHCGQDVATLLKDVIAIARKSDATAAAVEL
jgi:hypothetical protein